MPGKPGRSGNRTPRRGSRYIQQVRLDSETARSVKVLLLARSQEYTKDAVEAYVASLIEKDWAEYDDEIQRAVEAAETWQGEVL